VESQLKQMLEYEKKARDIIDDAQRKADKIRSDAQRKAEELLKTERFTAEDEAEKIKNELIARGKEEAVKMHARTQKNIQELETRAKKKMDKAAQTVLSEIFEIV